jgi:hypothetical protein
MFRKLSSSDPLVYCTGNKRIYLTKSAVHFSVPFHHTSMNPHFILLVLFCIAGSFVSAQKTPVIKMYAYTQSVLPGQKKNIIVNENGNTQEQTTPKKMNYFFYAEKKKQEPIKIAGIWMYGKKYLVIVSPATNTTVEISTNAETSGKITFMPAEDNEFLQILPGYATTKGTNLPSGLKKMVQQNELVLIYTWKGKTWYFPVKKIKNLSPVASV